MLIDDVIVGIWWWLGLFVLGLAGLPATWRIFPKFFDGGYALSKIITLATVGYIVWLLASLHLLSFSRWLIVAMVVFWAVGNWYFLRPSWSWKKYWKIIVFEEIIFALAFFFWLFVRAHQSAIFGLEKYMDFGFINSILRSDFFPPRDLWFYPKDINYYYFGHFLAALLIKLSGTPPAVGYNMVLSTILALSVLAAFCLGSNMAVLAKAEFKNHSVKIISGFVAVALVIFSGNLHTVYLFTPGYSQGSPPPFWQIWQGFNPDKYWYPNATRFIPNTIHEFPSYSWVVADLHGHVLDIPFVLTTLALLLLIFYQKKILFWQGAMLSLLMAVMYMTNALDSLVYLALFCMLALVMLAKTNLSSWLVACATVIILAILLILPFQVNFTPFTSGLGLVRDHSSWWMLLVLWGFFYWQIAALLIFAKKHWLGLWQKLDIDIYVIILAALSTGLIIFPEVFYIKDIYPVHYRANTMFKLGYQAFIMLGVASTYTIIKLLGAKWQTGIAKAALVGYVAISAVGLVLVLSYPYFAIKSYYNGLGSYQGLDGLVYLKQSHPSDYLAIVWLNNNIVGQPTIVEASGDSYTEFARVSANSGLPTIIGWPVHEWLWRKDEEAPFLRQAEVDTIYTTSSLSQLQSVLDKYDVEYIFWGDLEKQKYPNVNPARFDKLATIAYQNEETVVYKVNR